MNHDLKSLFSKGPGIFSTLDSETGSLANKILENESKVPLSARLPPVVEKEMPCQVPMRLRDLHSKYINKILKVAD